MKILRKLAYLLVITDISFFNFLLWKATKGDCLENKILDFLGLQDFIILIGLTFLSLIFVYFILNYCIEIRKIENTIKKKLRITAIVVFILFSYKTAQFSYRLITIDYENIKFREEICEKIKPQIMEGSRAENLTFKEYNEICKISGWFISISPSATNISYSYSNDGFLPDYKFELKYRVPVNVDIELIDKTNGQFGQKQSFEVIGNYKIVEYYEYNK